MANATKSPTRKPEDDQKGFYHQNKEAVPSDEDLREITGMHVGETDQAEAAARDAQQESFYKAPTEPVYDEEADPKRPKEKTLAQQERDAANTQPEAEHGKDQNKNESPEDIGAREKRTEDPPLYKGNGGKHHRLNWFKRKRNKIIIGVLMGGGGGIAGVVAFLLSLGPGLIPTLTFDIDDNRFARLSRRVTINTENIIRFKLALDSTGDEQYRQLIERYRPDDTTTRTGRLLGKIDSIRPQKLVERMALDVEFEYRTVYRIPGTDIERRKVTSVIYLGPNGVTKITIPQNNISFWQKVRHPYRYMLEHFESTTGFAGVLSGISARANPDAGNVQRLLGDWAAFRATKVAKQAFNIRKTARWSKADIERADKNPPTREEAHIEETQRSSAQATNDGARTVASAGADDDARRYAEQTNACAKDAECTKEMVDTGDTMAPDARADINRRFDPTSLTNMAGKVIGTTSAVVEVGALLCMINDANIKVSELSINAKSAMAAANFVSMSAAGDQQIYSQLNEDKRVNASLTGGYNDQINDGTVPDSNAFKEASGHPYNTDNTISPHSSDAGLFGSAPLGFLPPAAGSLLNRMEEEYKIYLLGGLLQIPTGTSFCDIVGNPWSSAAIALGEIGLSAIPGVGQGGKITATVVGKAVVKGTSTVFKKQLTKRALVEAGAFFGAQQLITLVGQTVAENRMGAFYNGIAQGAGYINGADAGAEVIAQKADAIANAARPLNQEEYQQAEMQDEAYRGRFAQTQSFSDRYFARDNPRSLLNRTVFATYTNFNLGGLGRITQSLVQNIGKIFNPASLLATATSTVNAQDDDIQVTDRDYGVVQYGWTDDEDNAYTGNDEYSPLWNEIKLDESGRADELQEKYGKCWDGETGTLLADNDIQRDENANILDDGLCSPSNMGDDTPNDGQVTFKNDESALVFRLRVSIRNNNAADSLIEVQEIPTDGEEDSEE